MLFSHQTMLYRLRETGLVLPKILVLDGISGIFLRCLLQHERFDVIQQGQSLFISSSTIFAGNNDKSLYQ
ncbi:hypothetical protein [Thiomicrorhabdus sp.]|uniref:hypothetical protein n=1 Tax=Thiomicrorhabdus sp. TaxID=2039724 RepID=UPI0029C85960|nr:hypothetical protein [Thiomicrorhabdus sp.]